MEVNLLSILWKHHCTKWEKYNNVCLIQEKRFFSSSNSKSIISFYRDLVWIDTTTGVEVFSLENSYTKRDGGPPGDSANIFLYTQATETDTTNLLYTSTEEPPNWGENNVMLYPNPVSYTLTADFTLPASQTVYFVIRDNSGTVVYSNSSYFMQGGNTYAFDVSAYTNGVYTLEIFPENLAPAVRKVIKQ